MFFIIGIIVVFVMVFGGFSLSGGKFNLVLKALPFELMMILGGALGAFIAANSGGILAGVGKGIGQVLKGPTWKSDDYKDLLLLMFLIIKTIKTKGVVAIEAHIENPDESKLFQQFPRVASDHHVVDFICDYVRMLTMNFDDPNQMEDAMNADLDKHHDELHEKQHALVVLADGLPAIGIVAAVLGIVKTMSAIAEPIEVLGGMIGGALVGTFLGIFLSYLVVAPIAGRFEQILREDGHFMPIIKYVMVSHLQGNAPQIAVEIGRRNVPSHLMPTFLELEEAISELPPDI